jgi:hypothetical protein
MSSKGLAKPRKSVTAVTDQAIELYADGKAREGRDVY